MIHTPEDIKYMRRCLELARLGLGYTYPNPLVGSVIVCNKKIIGEGYHQKAGESHAEVNAINSVKNNTLLKESTLYVNLEPCSHFGKTPPCANLIVSLKIPRVVIGVKDISSKVSGKGIDILKKAGIDVIVGVLEDESRDLNKRFFTFHEKKRPYIILKWAETKDGYIDRKRSSDLPASWITNKIAKKIVHKWRTEEQSIMIGSNTALMDNPKLTSREWLGNNPVRVVVDKNNNLSKNLNIWNEEAKTIAIFNSSKKLNFNKKGIFIEKIEMKDSFFRNLFDIFIKYDLQSIIIEGGKELLETFINHNYWDEARVFAGDITFSDGIPAPKFDSGIAFNKIYLGNSRLDIYKNLTD